jgi:hypothetical protein
MLGMLSSQVLEAQNPFNLENVEIHRRAFSTGLTTNQVALAWKEAQDPATKGEKFTLTLQEIAGTILDRQWTYPGGGEWPLVDWTKLSSLSDVIADQRTILESTHAIAQTDEELAKVCVLGEVILGLGTDAELWYENWLLSLAKSQKSNLKRVAILMTSGYAEDIRNVDDSEGIRTVNWNEWEHTFNQSDNLGKALLLVCMTDLASRKEEFVKVADLHIEIFNGTNDDLKAFALYAGNKKLGQAVVNKWQSIADNDPNPKLKILARELLNR